MKNINQKNETNPTRSLISERRAEENQAISRYLCRTMTHGAAIELLLEIVGKGLHQLHTEGLSPEDRKEALTACCRIQEEVRRIDKATLEASALLSLPTPKNQAL